VAITARTGTNRCKRDVRLPGGRAKQVRVQLLNQPWDASNQWFGYQLRNLLTDSSLNFTDAYLIFAFVKRSGVARVYDALKTFTACGGTVRAVLGLDEAGTTRQGVSMLLAAGVDVALFHDTSPIRTFHPKGCVFENKRRAVLLVGSSNLTQGGLFTNYELGLRIDLDLAAVTDDNLLVSFKTAFNQYWQSGTTVQSVNAQRLAELAAYWPALLPDEDLVDRAERTPRHGEAEPSVIPNPFRSLGFQGPPPPTYPPGLEPRSGGGQRQPETQATVPPPITARQAGRVSGFWKVLSSFDVSTSSAPGQMIIPKDFVDLFPELTQIIEAAPEGGGRTWEAELPVSFTSESAHLNVSTDARVIMYEPRTTHARPNTELRFTFRNRRILEALNHGDMLVFVRDPASASWFNVQHLTPTDSRYAVVRGDRTRWFGKVSGDLANMLRGTGN
jgi:HKD family nuclease